MKRLLIFLLLLPSALANWTPGELSRTARIAESSAAPSWKTGLVAYWKLDEASGNRSDSVGSETLTDNNTVASGTGKVANAADFELSNSESLSIADDATMSTGDIDFSFACWVNLESTPGSGSSRGIVGKMANSGHYEYQLQVNNQSGTIRFRFLVSNNGTALVSHTATTFGAPSTATWYFIVVWHDATANTLNIQVNDGTVDSVSHTTGVYGSGTDGFAIGTIGAGGVNYLDGLVDEVGFWKRTLTTQERTDLYNGGSGTTY